MKILMLTPYLPYPPSAGGQVRSYNLIKQLSKSHEITLACFTRESNTGEQIAHMEKFCKKVMVFKRGKAWTIPNILRTGLSLFPFLVMIYYTPEIRSRLEDELSHGDYDLIHAETFYVMPYLPKSNVPTVLVEQTIMSRVFSHQVKIDFPWFVKPIAFIDVLKIRYWERFFWKNADRLVAVSEEDAVIIHKSLPSKKVYVIPNGVGEDFSNQPKTLHKNNTILYMGNYKWIQNWEAAEILATKVFPIVKKHIPDAKVMLAGQFPTPRLKALANRDIEIVEFQDNDTKGVVGSYKRAGVLVAPIYGPGGTRLKTLAAMASMVPVVTTPIGAEGYGAINGTSILVGATPQEIATQTVEILSDRKLYQKIAVNARKLVDEQFSWEPIAQKLEAVYEEIVHHHS